MIDPREKKLPKWVQDLLHAERLKTALRFPDRPFPEPDFKPNKSQNADIPTSVDVVYCASSVGIWKKYVKGRILYSSQRFDGFGQQPRDDYYLNLDDARLAHRWMLANEFASRLLAAEFAEPKA